MIRSGTCSKRSIGKSTALTLALALVGASAAPLFAGGVGTQCEGKFIYKMNIIGVSNPKTAPMTNTSRKTIFVALGANGAPAKSTIYLTQGAFAVCDANSWDQAHKCDGTNLGSYTGSVFRLPCNLNIEADFACDGQGEEACYDIYFRALGKPGGKVTITTCGILPDGVTKVCSSENTGLISRNAGKPTFTKVTNALTSLVGCTNVNDSSTCGRYALFRDEFQQFLWEYDNQGLKNGMVVFCGADCD